MFNMENNGNFRLL